MATVAAPRDPARGDVGTRGVTGPCAARRVMNRCHVTSVPLVVNECMSNRYFDPITSAGPIVAAFGGTAPRSPLLPKNPLA